MARLHERETIPVPQDGWRRAMDRLPERLQIVAAWLEKVDPPPEVLAALDGPEPEDVCRRAAHLLQSARGNARAEERDAWDLFAANAQDRGGQSMSAADASDHADRLMGERRARFGEEADTKKGTGRP